MSHDTSPVKIYVIKIWSAAVLAWTRPTKGNHFDGTNIILTVMRKPNEKHVSDEETLLDLVPHPTAVDTGCGRCQWKSNKKGRK